MKGTVVQFFLLFFALAAPVLVFGQTGGEDLSVIPRPLMVKKTGAGFQIQAGTRILVDPGNDDLLAIGKLFSAQLNKLTNISLSVTFRPNGGSGKGIQLTTVGAPDSLGTEGYHLSVTSGRIVIRAPKPAGGFYAVQTLLQLLPFAPAGRLDGVLVPGAEITDRPRFSWRGVMLDVGRYFYPVDFIKTYIDELAMHKINIFHWHLTEDHGWRIEIKKYPELTAVGAWRAGTQYGHTADQIDHQPHGGYYTQAQIKEVVAYARQRYVTIVPEIEMPGHSLAALAAYPQLSCTGGPFKVPVAWGIQKDIYCAGNEQTFKFLEDVLSEVADLFPGPYIHIGGDEAPKDRWKSCPKCQARIKAEGLKDEQALQSYFIRRIAGFLQTKNKQVIGWDEILEGGLPPGAAVMSWRGLQGGVTAARQQHPVIMTPRSQLYFDFLQGAPYLEPTAIGRMVTTLEKVYNYEPVPAELPAEAVRYFTGVQGCVWGEYIHSPAQVTYMTFPRAAALAEVGWTAAELKNWEDFKQRMDVQYSRYAALGINYAESAYQVGFASAVDPAGHTATITLTAQVYQPEIRYTTDGTVPTANSVVYEKPLVLPVPLTIKAGCFRNGQLVNGVTVSIVR